jgi:hypothetical protein
MFNLLIRSIILLPFHFADSTGSVLVYGGTNDNVKGTFDTGLPNVTAGHSQLILIFNIVIGIIAAISVLFVMIGGLRYVFSDGDPQEAATARKTIIYAVVGLLIAITAEGLVAFVLDKVIKGG